MASAETPFAIWQESEVQVVAATIGELSIKVSSPDVEIQALSGGNQQKWSLAARY